MFKKDHTYYYFCLYDFSLIESINQWLFNSFKPCTFIEQKLDISGVYKNYFNMTHGIVELGLYETEQLIYKDEEHILCTLLNYYKNIKYKKDVDITNNRLLEMDQFMKNKIKTSQEKFPERWI